MKSRPWFEGIIAIVAMALPLAALLGSQVLVKAINDARPNGTSQQELHLIEPEMTPVLLRSSAEIIVSTRKAPSLRYRGGEGIVSELKMPSSQMLRHGDHVISIDGLPFHLFVSDLPLIEDITPNSDTELLTTLVKFLEKNVNTEIVVKDQWSQSLNEAIRSFARKTGRQDPGVRFPAEWILWNSDPVMLDQVEIELNQRIYTDDTVATVKPVIVGLELTGVTNFDLQQPYEVVHDAHTLDIAADSEKLLIETDGSVEYLTAQLTDETRTLRVEIVAKEEVDLLRLPSSAVILREPGIGCVFTERDSTSPEWQSPAPDEQIALEAHAFDIRHEQYGYVFADPLAGLPQSVVADIDGLDVSQCGRTS